MQIKGINPEERVVFLDYLRIIACFMVIMVHSCEFFFIDGDSIGIRNASDGFWVSVVDSFFRSSVPLFVMASSYLLLPLKGNNTEVFFKRRFVRVVIPFVVWSLLYAILPLCWGAVSLADVKSNLIQLLTNFGAASGHLWYIYMLIGLYMFMPVLSPWLREASKRGLQLFLAVWFVTTFWHYAKLIVGDLYGECYWNEFHMFWYFSGFIGYLVLAYYIRTYIDWSLKKSLCIGGTLFIVGYLFTAIVYYQRTFTATQLQELELSWRFCSFNVVFMTFGAFVILKKITFQGKWLYGIVRQLSGLSYGIYLMHIFLLGFSYNLIGGHFSTPVTIALVGVSTFTRCCILAKLISYLPGSKYLIG
ncbi:surface polysaccharide O-acyltransferase-like enzyme [Dysgonomonas alginatilytica]|uniref:Surface polysaccharide O-acyltransferase-like enzyme n=1 Tax=Dysgonomonas alginatilytica TaxID=1605892 RepID=A0A2V3PUV9_9BACT|nr:acyltransferase family protein [Dysgonomonas alginatilytica]PXV68074.1 surface polysaccharide O-acyltransferase-like enzyme [Dysgonomonas alginatilytica]